MVKRPQSTLGKRQNCKVLQWQRQHLRQAKRGKDREGKLSSGRHQTEPVERQHRLIGHRHRSSLALCFPSFFFFGFSSSYSFAAFFCICGSLGGERKKSGLESCGIAIEDNLGLKLEF
ncbi:hypothetical protein L6164_000505 [Bauhinia variegata]|uniref:Uncharacterized protein n=1 Tax=Bauhinia variegata TaxID=167791 RepID=A0ACB9Q6N0_BAUVA|nr:hypothetical protein L6164_000505 [Bauhinia variegata]